MCRYIVYALVLIIILLFKFCIVLSKNLKKSNKSKFVKAVNVMAMYYLRINQY